MHVLINLFLSPKAVWNVGAIGAAINMPNKATEAVKKALATASTRETKKVVPMGGQTILILYVFINNVC